MENREDAVHIPSFRDRKTGLVVFGIILIIIGLLLALLSLMCIAHIYVFLGLFLAVPAVWFISMGIGSIKARRWARALLLVTSWVWFIGEINIFIIYIYNEIAQGAQIYEDNNSTWIWFMLVVFIIAPVILILFYGSKNVKATCEFRNPQISWTDKCPLPVLALSFIYIYMAVLMLPDGLRPDRSNAWGNSFFWICLGRGDRCGNKNHLLFPVLLRGMGRI
jgi:hypothetical protein